MNHKPLTDTVSPVTNAELATFLAVDPTDPNLPSMLIAATDMAIAYTQRDLIHRDWKSVFFGYSDLRCQGWGPYGYLELPYSELVSVATVEVDGEELDPEDFEIDTEPTPGRLRFLSGAIPGYKVTVAYKAGMGANAGAIPGAIKQAIKQIAGYLYEHRGDCDADEALVNSGAMGLLQRFKVERL